MAEELNDNKVISKRNSGFPEYLDFDKLRTEGIEYLGNLSGKIWTDHNVHDPGITILEMLCYALVDLGYRTNLPTKDIFAQDPEVKSVENNFLTPSQILTCNPLTITDFRKLLVDIDGVKNAWLQVATDYNPEQFCTPDQPTTDPNTTTAAANATATDIQPACCINYLNGLYHVYLDLEKNIDKDFESAEAKDKYVADVLGKVKKALMSHRNICEDFIDVNVLCKWEIGVCAEIELENGADTEKVYLEMMEKLRQFFSPAPRFYTLSQLLDKEKSIDDIFAGRPYNITESHGFIDTEEFESLKLRKEIHVSDVYNVLFNVAGIRSVKRLRLRNCSAKSLKEDKWVVRIPIDHVPDFSVSCSGFEFVREGITVVFNFKKYETILQLNFEHNGKIVYREPSDKLDTEIPKGIYRKDLSNWYSIQNEFPRVYGIEEGGLPADASPLRKAQALQLKGYLFFFDQLLANYLSQLKNIRSLFAPTPPDGTTKRQTYFMNSVESVPDIKQLIRDKSQGTTFEGNTLAFPVSKAALQELGSEIKNLELEKNWKGIKIPSVVFPTVAERDVAVSQLKEDFSNNEYATEIITRDDGCVFYYLSGSSDDIVLLSTRYYSNEQEARAATDLLGYAGMDDINYHSFTTADQDSFSFDIRLKLSDFSKHLELIAENATSYQQRRQGFLNHLLSRFAETFTDYALLSFGFNLSPEFQNKETKAKEVFLSNYSAISSNRGRALDYTLDGWRSDNISGFERRFKALAGAQTLQRQSLCNFEVYKYEEKYKLHFALRGDPFFTSSEKFDSPAVARHAAKRIFEAAGWSDNYYIQDVAHEKTYAVHLQYDNRKEVVFTNTYETSEIAKHVKTRLSRMFASGDVNGKPQIATYKYTSSLTDYRGLPVRIYSTAFSLKDDARAAALKNFARVNDVSIWKPAGEKSCVIEKLIYESASPEQHHFIDIERFRIDIDATTIGKPGVITYELLDKDNHRFKFRTVNEFKNEKEARDDVRRLLFRMTKIENYVVHPDNESGKWAVFIIEDGKEYACSVFHSDKEAERMKDEIHSIVQQFEYHLQIDPVPDAWRFDYYLGYEPGKEFTIQSLDNFPSKDEAIKALEDFADDMATAETKKEKGKLVIRSRKQKKEVATYSSGGFIAAGDADPDTLREPVNSLLKLIKEIVAITANKGSEEVFASYVVIDEESLCPYVYQLVDKDGLYAFYQHSDTEKVSVDQARKDAIKKNPDEYNFPELCLRGDVTIERKTTDGETTWYHYQLKTANKINKPGGGAAEKLVLFESTKGYPSKEQAEKAFAENYFIILLFGLTEDNYGDRKPISERELLIQSDDPFIRTESIVYVPSVTLAFLGTYTGQSVKELIKVVKSYPVRSIRKQRDCEEFSDRFLPCEKKECSQLEVDCNGKQENPVYFFILFDRGDDEEHWQSSHYYDTPEAALEAFRFFLLLLQYEGNYFIDCDCTGLFKLFVREVLVESTDRFESPAAAWGKNGIQKFISVSQQPQSFYAYTDKACCNKFFIACKNVRIVHPCQYNTPKIRNEVLLKLYHALEGITSWKFQEFCGPWDEIMKDFTGNAVATLQFSTPPTNKPAHYLEAYSVIIEGILRYGLCVDEEKVYLADGKSILFDPITGSGITAVELKEKLLWLACFFPFIRTDNRVGGIRNKNPFAYCIEIRLPDFNTCDLCKSETHQEEKTDDEERCPVAWTSECCYPSCELAISAYDSMIDALKNFEYYMSVFDCTCGPYGIVVHGKSGRCVRDIDETVRTVDFVGHILAINPQCYPSAEMLCSAIERSKNLINAEGLHVMEHILLRPHDAAECDCRIIPCPNEIDTACKFPYWKDNDDEDPCDDSEPVCFEPGQDPYSFIATVALPAWPERFRKKESRDLVENMLFREAPAHVMLRVLWLSPHDLCCFEQHMKKWLVWMAYKTSCRQDYNTCDFIDFLFRREFECLDESVVCDTCTVNQNSEDSCVDGIKKEEQDMQTENKECRQTWLEQVTELYCWGEFNCTDHTYIDCESRNKKVAAIPRDVIVSSNQVDTSNPTPLLVTEPTVAKPKNVDEAVDKPKFINGRMAVNKTRVDKIVKSSNENDLALKTRRFLDASYPSPQAFNTLAADILKVRKQSGSSKEALSRKQVDDLLEIIIHFVLDKNCFNGKDFSSLQKCRPTFDAMRKAKVNLSKMYKAWGPKAVKNYEPDLDVEGIENLLKK